MPTSMPPPAHALLLSWLMLVSLVIFGTAVILDQGLLQEMLRADRSQICLVVIAMYLVGVGHTFVHTRRLSRELEAATTLMGRLEAGRGTGLVSISAEHLNLADGRTAPGGFLCDYLRDHFAPRSRRSEDEPTVELLEAHASRLRGATEFGWFYIDLMLKVGFLGTLVGFILMLSSVADTGSLDANTMQKVLKQMSLGMSTALYTTLASLVGGILLSVPYYLHDRSVERLLRLCVQVRDVLLPPLLPARG